MILRLMSLVMLTVVMHVHVAADDKQKQLHQCLRYAIRINVSLTEIQGFIKGVKDINAQHGDLNETLYHVAADNDRDEVITELHKNGANPNIKDIFGYTPLHSACRKSKLDAVRALLQCGANSQEKDRWGKTPADIAREFGNRDIMKLIEYYENIPDTKEPEED